MLRRIRAAAVFIVGLGWAAVGCRQPHISVAKAKDRIERLVPKGSEPSRAFHVLDSMRVVHSGYEENAITANLGESFHQGPVSGDLLLTLTYGSQDRLERVEVKEVLTGP